jgi:hypothetical protein
MACLTRRLESSAGSRWRTKTAGADGRARHWLTRVGYYRAVVDALAQTGAAEIDVNAVLRAHANGRTSTVYSIAATGSMTQFYRSQQNPADRRIADLVPAGPVQHLLAEVKAWSFWPVRTAWVRELDEQFPAAPFKTAAHRLAQALASWRSANPELAATQDGLLPLCAIEDLVILGRGAVPAERAVALLADATPSGDLLLPREFRCPRGPALDDTVVGDVVARIDAAVRLLGAGAEHRPAVSLLRSALRDLSSLSRGGAAG